MRVSGTDNVGRKQYDVQYVNSGYISKNKSYSDIRNGEVKDRYAPTVSGVGYIGNVVVKGSKNINRKIYETWKNMLYRCYNPKCYSYRYYGAKGVTVCKEWLCFETFLNDVKSLPGYNEELIMNRIIELDKDIINRADKQYNKQNCQWVLVSENRREGGLNRWQNYRLHLAMQQ